MWDILFKGVSVSIGPVVSGEKIFEWKFNARQWMTDAK